MHLEVQGEGPYFPLTLDGAGCRSVLRSIEIGGLKYEARGRSSSDILPIDHVVMREFLSGLVRLNTAYLVRELPSIGEFTYSLMTKWSMP